MALTLSYLLSLATVFGDILVLILFALLFIEHPIRRVIAKFALWGAFLIALTGTIASLFYSEVLRYAPCNMCWYQRVVLYPQVIILGFALRFKDRAVMRYIAWLSALGAIMAFYTHGLEMGWFPEGAICGVGAVVSCARRYVFDFGYVTIPIMALTGFLLSLLLALHALKTKD